MKYCHLLSFVLSVVALPLGGYGQTTLDLRTQSRSVDFSAANFTRPSKTGTSLPATCSVGETIFKLDAPAGGNLYGCTSGNQWTVLGGSAESLQGNSVASDTPTVPGQFYGWDPLVNKLSLYSFGSLLAISGSTVNVATDSVPQYGASTGVPGSCSQYGLFYFKTDAGDGAKLYYCNGTTYESVSGGVPSVFGRSGAIGAQAGDYSAIQITNTPSGNITSTTVQGALTELDAGKASLTHAHGASDITSGTLADARISQSSVIQYQSALSISGSQITSGTIPSSQLPNPAPTAGGKVQSKVCVAGNFVSGINMDSTVTCSAPAGGGGGSLTLTAPLDPWGYMATTSSITLNQVNAPYLFKFVPVVNKTFSEYIGAVATAVAGAHVAYALYDSSFNEIAGSESAAIDASTAVPFVAPLASPLTLTAGTSYYLAISYDNATIRTQFLSVGSLAPNVLNADMEHVILWSPTAADLTKTQGSIFPASLSTTYDTTAVAGFPFVRLK